MESAEDVYTYYDFIVVADTLYKINRDSGEAWFVSHGCWYKVKEEQNG